MARVFDHVGIPTGDPRPGEFFVERTRVWITDPAAHPQRIEWLRFEPDSPVTGPVREMPHIAFRVESVDEAIEGEEVVLGPFNATEALRVVFILKDGAVFEFMEQARPGNWFPVQD